MATAVGDNRGVDLDADCIFGFSPGLFDFQMLLHPFEQQFDGPTVFIKKGDL